MQLFTEEQRLKLLSNGDMPGQDHAPVVKLFTPMAGCTWLLTELDPEDPDMAFGLCDLGLGFPEIGYVYLPEITAASNDLRLRIERDLQFEGKFPLSVYANAARRLSRIVTDEKHLIVRQAPGASRDAGA